MDSITAAIKDLDVQLSKELFDFIKDVWVQNISFLDAYNMCNNGIIQKFKQIFIEYDYICKWKKIITSCMQVLCQKHDYKFITLSLTTKNNDILYISNCLNNENIDLPLNTQYNGCKLILDDKKIALEICIDNSLYSGYVIEINGKCKDYSGKRKIQNINDIITGIYMQKIGVL